MEKEIKEVPFRFYGSFDEANSDTNGCTALVEVEGNHIPHTVTKTMITSRDRIELINCDKALINPNYIASCIFKLRTINNKSVYVLETIEKNINN